MSERRFLNPAALGPRPSGYTNGVLASGRLLFVAGQIGWDADQQLVSHRFLDQFRRALENIRLVLEEAGGGPEHLARVTIYVTDKKSYLAEIREIGATWREVLGKNFPAMTLVEVADLLEEGALVEVEATAVLPEETA